MCRIAELRNKEVINIRDGQRLGSIYDVEVDVPSGNVVSIIVPEKTGIFGSGKNEYIIPWREVCKVGDDIVLVDTDVCARNSSKSKRGQSFCI